MRFFLSYVKQHRAVIAAFALFCVIFAAAFALYHLPPGAVVYPALVSALVGVIIALGCYICARRRHRRLDGIVSVREADIDDIFPKAATTDDDDYRRIIALLRDEQRNSDELMKKRYADMVDYYTVWAHQIKTPIASMRLHLQNEDSPLSRKLTADLFRVEQYVEMVLVFLRLDSEQTDYVFGEYDLDGIIRQAIRKFAGEFIERRLQLIYEPVGLRVVTDEKWLSFVLEQLISNALKYTPHGSVSISLEAPMILAVTDTGIGISPSDMPRIFERGYTGYNGREDKKASGIGLYLCRRICRNLGHTISASSVPDRGTTVRIDFSQKRALTE